jgi:hypothetical protein
MVEKNWKESQTDEPRKGLDYEQSAKKLGDLKQDVNKSNVDDEKMQEEKLVYMNKKHIIEHRQTEQTRDSSVKDANVKANYM